MSAPHIVHDATQRRFSVRLAGGEGELRYRLPSPHLLDLFHTEVTPALRGQGIAAELVAAASAYARANGDKILPSCPYVRYWFEQHPEANDLLSVRP